ncbi:MAG: DUF4339 domain-containing protein [Gemmataceae bacterium]|nr:DUF4339 domain-containing protein [Gemmataceae bacterium]
MWYYARNGQAVGPVAFAELQRMASAGQLHPSDHVLQAGTQDWVAAGGVPGLFAVVQPVRRPYEERPAAVYPQAAPYAGALGPPAPNPLVTWWNAVVRHFKRAFTWDLRRIEVTESEQQHLAARGTDHPTVQRYLVWRRSILLVVCVPTALIALLNMIDGLSMDLRGLSTFGRLWIGLQILIPYALPAAVVLAAVFWSTRKLSSRLIAYGWAVSFLGPILLLLVPGTWLVDLQAVNPQEQAQAQVGARLGFGVLVFLWLCLTLPVFIISMGFGVQRACLRLKTLLPESVIPGLFLAAAAPILPLVLLPLFALINQLGGSTLLLLGMLLLMASSLVYAFRARDFIRPLVTASDFQRVRVVQWIAKGTFWGGVFLLMLFALVTPLALPRMGGGPDQPGGQLELRTLLGFSSDSSLARPWDWRILRWLVIETLGRSLFTTILVADLFMRINRSVWYYSRQLAATQHADGYDQLMNKLGETYAPGQANVQTAPHV